MLLYVVMCMIDK